MAQQTFWRKNNQWLSEIALHLSSEQMEEICGGSNICHKHIVRGTHLEKSLHSSRRMLCSLAFITMWQQHYQTILQFPFIFGCGNVLVDHNLCAVAEITKLSFPKCETSRTCHSISIIKSNHSIF